MNLVVNKLVGITALMILVGAGCAPQTTFMEPDIGTQTGDGPKAIDPATVPCKAGQDADRDGINDDREGCAATPADTDADSIPDYLDTDSDSDGVPDQVEKDVDTDKDGEPDFRDEDSDNDGVFDGDEDLNGDGFLGCCLSQCGEQRKGCPPVKPDACGVGQQCQNGTCTPAIDFLCGDGESLPTKAQTYATAQPDNKLPTNVCHKPGEDKDTGLKPIKLHRSEPGQWRIAVDPTAVYSDIKITGATDKEVLALVDFADPNQQVAGFVLSIPSPQGDLTAAVSTLIKRLSGGDNFDHIEQVSSGQTKTTHDKFDAVVGTDVSIKVKSAAAISVIRDTVVQRLMDKSFSSALPSTKWGSSAKEFTLRMETVSRPDGRTLVIGGVGSTSDVSDTARQTNFVLDDLSNGSGIATPSDSDEVECDPFIKAREAQSDIIWVMDESGSMDDNRKDIVSNATDFLNRAVKAGLDFRMAVTGMKNPTPSSLFGSQKVTVGKLCGHEMDDGGIFGSGSDDGGPDIFLDPKDDKIFKSCINNPPYNEESQEYGLANAFQAVTRHLPRKANDPSKIRPDASIVLIIVSDEAPEELKNSGKYDGKSGFLKPEEYGTAGLANACPLASGTQKKIDDYLKKWVELYQGKSSQFGAAAETTVHFIGGLCQKCTTTSPPELGRGYLELAKATGGITGDICQTDLGATLQSIVDSISGAASPMVLQYTPISASLSVAVGEQILTRSRVKGFDYVGASNSIVLVNSPAVKGTQIVASYRRWVRQASIDK